MNVYDWVICVFVVFKECRSYIGNFCFINKVGYKIVYKVYFYMWNKVYKIIGKKFFKMLVVGFFGEFYGWYV